VCCATKNFLVNIIVWFIALLGLAPVSEDLISKFEAWVDPSFINKAPIVSEYYVEDDRVLSAYVYHPENWDEAAIWPAMITFHCTDNELRIADALSERLAERGYVSISFEYPVLASVVSADILDSAAQAAMRWTYENTAALGVNPLKIALWGRGDLDSVPARLALHALTVDESEDVIPLADPSALVLISSRCLLEFDMAGEDSDHAGAALLLEDIESGLPPTVLLVSDSATSEQLVSVDRFLTQMIEVGNSCEIGYYEGGKGAKTSQEMPQDEFEALAAAMHATLHSTGFWNEKE